MKSKVFLKFVTTYSIVLLIPIIILSIFVYTQFVNILTDEVKNSAINTLLQMRDTVDGYIDELTGISAHIDSNPKIRSLILTDNLNDIELYPKAVDAIMELNNYKTSNNMIDNIMIIYKDMGAIISNSSKYEMNSYFKYNYKFDDSDYELIKQQIDNASDMPVLVGSKSVYSNSNSSEVISFIRSMPINFTRTGKVLLITIKEQVIKDMIMKTIGNYKGSVFIFDLKNNIIDSFNIGDKTVQAQSALDFVKQHKGSNTTEIKIDNQDYIVSYITSEKTRLVYVSFIESEQILEKVEYVKNTMTEVIVLIVLSGLLLVYIFSRSNYKNLKSITNLIKMMKKRPALEDKNEYELIRNTLNTFMEENELLNVRLEEQIPIMRNSFFVRLLKGKFTSIEEINERIAFHDLKFSDCYFAVLSISIDYSNDLIENAIEYANRDILRIRITNEILSVLSKISNGFSIDFDPDNIVILLSLPKDNLQSKDDLLSECEETLNNLLEQNSGIGITMGLSNLHELITNTYKAYKEALKALDYRIIKGSNNVILFREAELRSENRYYYSFVQEKQILGSLKVGDFNSIQIILKQTIESIKNSRVSTNIAKCIYFEIFNTALKSLNELGLDESKIRFNLPSMVQIKTLDEVYNAISLFYKDICELIIKTRNSKSSSLLESIIEYINTNSTDPSLSVESTASALNISSSYLSRVFKEQSGSSFTDYVHIVRLGNAKKLLTESNDNVSLISEAVGYGNTRNFIRVFKKFEGITPTEYRLSQDVKKP